MFSAAITVTQEQAEKRRAATRADLCNFSSVDFLVYSIILFSSRMRTA